MYRGPEGRRTTLVEPTKVYSSRNVQGVVHVTSRGYQQDHGEGPTFLSFFCAPNNPHKRNSLGEPRDLLQVGRFVV